MISRKEGRDSMKEEFTYTTNENSLKRHIYANIRSIEVIYGLSKEELKRIMDDVNKALNITSV